MGESLKQLTACSIEFKRSSTFFWCICRAVYPISYIKEGEKKKKKTHSESERERDIGKRIQELGIIPSYQELDLCDIITAAEDLESMAKEKH